jgi:hypothetical protein
MLRPPPCTTIGLIPTACMKHTSFSRASSVSGWSMIDPPTFTTTSLPANWRM